MDQVPKNKMSSRIIDSHICILTLILCSYLMKTKNILLVESKADAKYNSKLAFGGETPIVNCGQFTI